jgi:hypothetical protein
LASTHPDREVLLQSYYEEKGGIEEMGTFRKITLGEYRALREKGAPKAIPTMTIKKDEQLMPLRLKAKSRIVMLGNRKNHDWSNSDRLRPLSGSTVSVSWLVCRPNIVGPSNRGVAKTPSAKGPSNRGIAKTTSVKEFFRMRKQLLSDPPRGTRMHPRTNTGFFSKLCMASVGVHATGMTK